MVARTAESLGVPVAAQLTGWNPQALYAAVEAGHPVLVWTTVNYSSQTARTWTAWDGRSVPWTEAGHVVVLMGVNTSAGTLEFSDPLTGSYNGTTMAQFARTFTIYGSMAIVIERIARAASTPRHRAARGGEHLSRASRGSRASNRTPRAVGSLAPRPHPERVQRKRQRRRRRREPRPADRRHRCPDAATWRCHSTACRGIEPRRRSGRDTCRPHAEATASMRWVTFTQSTYSGERTGLLVDGRIHACGPGTTLLSLLGDDGTLLAAEGDELRRDPHDVFELDSVQVLAPIPRPPTVRDFYAFEQHVRTARQRRGLEMDPDWYELPVFYFSNPYAIVGPDVDVAIPPGGVEMDYELEVAAVVGVGGADLDPEEAERSIAGYCVMNDWSARDIQRREMKLSMGPVKGKDFATSIGPVFVTPDELEDTRRNKSYDLEMTATVNGVEYSRASLADIFWSFGEMIAYASRGTRVETGDIIGSGTCGTGCILELSMVHGIDQYPWLQPGDVVELSVERLGTLRNRVVAGTSLRPLR